MTLHYLVSQPLTVVFEHLTQIDKFVDVHPVIFKAETTGVGTYKMYEKLKFGFIPVMFLYPASIAFDKERSIVTMKAVVMKIVHVEIHFKLTEKDGQIEVIEDIQFRTFLPIKFILRSIFKTQHGLLFRNIGLV